MSADVTDYAPQNLHEERGSERPAFGLMLEEVDNMRRVQKPYMPDSSRDHAAPPAEENRTGLESTESRSYSDELRDFVRSWTDEPLFRLAYYIAIFSLSMQHGHKGLSWHDYEFYPQRDQPGLAQEKVKQESHKEKDGWF